MERKPKILAAVRPQGGVAVRRALGAYAEKSMGATGFIDMPLLHADNATDVDFRSQVLRHIR